MKLTNSKNHNATVAWWPENIPLTDIRLNKDNTAFEKLPKLMLKVQYHTKVNSYTSATSLSVGIDFILCVQKINSGQSGEWRYIF